MMTDAAFFTISSVVHLTESVNRIRIEGLLDTKLRDRHAGQYASIRIPAGDCWSAPHPFTISNAPRDPYLEMTIKQVGEFTTNLRSIATPLPVQVAGPFGKFCTTAIGNADVVMIAGGMGITPFLSVLHHMKNIRSVNNVTLFWANNAPRDYFGLDELAHLAAHVDLTVILVVRDQAEMADGKTLRVKGIKVMPGLLTRELLQSAARLEGKSIYLCGSGPMQAFVLEQLRLCGVDPATVDTEKFGSP